VVQQGGAARSPAPENTSARGTVARAMTSPAAHPHFDDRGTLSWHTKWKEALAEARASRRMIFVELGREL